MINRPGQIIGLLWVSGGDYAAIKYIRHDALRESIANLICQSV
jgi:hypothetical protein